jgi:hypothetical protein
MWTINTCLSLRREISFVNIEWHWRAILWAKLSEKFKLFWKVFHYMICLHGHHQVLTLLCCGNCYAHFVLFSCGPVDGTLTVCYCVLLWLALVQYARAGSWKVVKGAHKWQILRSHSVCMGDRAFYVFVVLRSLGTVYKGKSCWSQLASDSPFYFSLQWHL